MSNTAFDRLLVELLKNEGGYVDHPNDPGGATNYGITEKVARANGFKGSMRDLTKDDALAIYRREYFEDPGFAQVYEVSPGIAAELFDTGVNMGPKVPSEWLQRSLNTLNREGRDFPDLVADGHIGPATISALKHYLDQRGGPDGEAVMLKALNCLQGERYLMLAEHNPKLESFVYGWLANRVDMSI